MSSSHWAPPSSLIMISSVLRRYEFLTVPTRVRALMPNVQPLSLVGRVSYEWSHHSAGKSCVQTDGSKRPAPAQRRAHAHVERGLSGLGVLSGCELAMPYDRNDDWARKNKMKSAGMFSTPSYWGVGEPFDDSVTSARAGAQGLQMVTNKQRTGITGDNWNRNNGRRKDFIRLYEGEVQVDPGTYDRRWKMEQKKKNLTPDGFRYARAPQQSSGLGGNWGRIGPRLEYMPETEGTDRLSNVKRLVVACRPRAKPARAEQGRRG